MEGSKKVGIAIVAVIIVLILISSAAYTVAEDEYAVVTQFNKITGVEDTAGLKFKLPFIQSVRKVSKAIQIYDIDPSDVMTSDKKSMIADDYILWRVTDPSVFMKTLNGSVSNAQYLAGVATYNATKSIISSMTQDEVIAARGEKLTVIITEEANEDMTKYGLEILQAQIKSLDLPDDNKAAVYERMISERNNIAASYTAQGEASAQKIRNETDRTVSVMKADARKQASILEAEGEAEYMNILKNAYNDKDKAEFYNFARSLDALELSLRSGDKTIMLDKDSELAGLLYGSFLDEETE
ncbi:MAG: protease modulator HflC [Lachnospiraceae bacterium]|nr:protease modulator HflC [Lachnospiraceae bacterium]